MASQWFYQCNGVKFGPVTVEQLKSLVASLQISPTDLILKEGTEEWVKASRLKGLFHESAAGPTPRPAPQRSAVDATPASARIPASQLPLVSSGNDKASNGKDALGAEHINATISAARRHGAGFVGRFKQIDFKREVWPLDAAAFRTLTSEPAFWAVTLLSALPLFFATLTEPEYQLNAFALYFAAIWGLIFRFSVISGVRIGWGWLAAALIFTGAVGISLLLKVVYPVLPTWYLSLINPDHDALSRLCGFVFQVGIFEESCKIIPVVGLMLLLRKKLTYSDIVMIGIFSGLGFAAFENLGYFKSQPDKIFNAIMSSPADLPADDPNAGQTALHQVLVSTSQSSMVLAMMRSISLTFGHAVWSAIFAHFMAVARGAGVKRLPLWIVGLITAAMFHGVYDWLWGIQATLPVLTTVVSFMLLKLYVVQGTSTSNEERQAAISPEELNPLTV